MENIIPFSQEGSPDFSILPSAARIELIKRSEVVLLTPEETILESFDYSEHVYFIFKGLIAGYVQRGEESTVRWIRGNNDFAFAWNMDNNSFGFQKQLTGQIMVALEETHAIKISFENLRWLQDKWPAIKDVLSFHMREYLALDKWLQVKGDLQAKEKYEFVQRHVKFQLDKVPDVYLASWSGIRLEELRVIRKR